MRLIDILSGVDYTLLKGNINVEINDIKYNSKEVKENDVFVALIGYEKDGHDFIESAIEKGAKVIVSSKIITSNSDITIIKVDDTRVALAAMSKNYFRNPEQELTIIGVTGTTGKTTTTHMIKEMLESSGLKCGLIGSIGIKYNNEIIHTNNTTPESYDIFKSLRIMADHNITHVAMEVSSQSYKFKRLSGLVFEIGVLTNITTDHIGPGEHESWEEYVSCKNKLFLNSKKIIINNDSQGLPEVLNKVCIKPMTYSVLNKSDLQASSIKLINNENFFGTEFTTNGVINFKFRVSILGEFNVYNALCAILVCQSLNIDIKKGQEGLLNCKVRGRMETALVTPKYKVLIDYAHTEDGMKCLVKTLRDYKPKRLVSIFGGGGNRPKERRYNLGEIIGGSSDLCIITTDNPRFEEISSINEDIKVGLNRVDAKYIEIEDRACAIKYACNNALEGDLILLVGKGHEEYQDIKGIKHHFSEIEVIEELKKENNIM